MANSPGGMRASHARPTWLGVSAMTVADEAPAGGTAGGAETIFMLAVYCGGTIWQPMNCVEFASRPIFPPLCPCVAPRVDASRSVCFFYD